MDKSLVNVLIVDDVRAIRMRIKELLRGFGFQNLHEADSGEEAKYLLESRDIQLVLCDWHMIPCDGLELLMYIRKHPKHKDIAFLFLTAENTQGQVVKAIQNGVDDYLLKPLTPVQIQTKICNVLIKKKIIEA